MNNEVLLKEHIINYLLILNEELRREDLIGNSLYSLIGMFFSLLKVNDKILKDYFIQITGEDVFSKSFAFSNIFIDKLAETGALDVRNLYIYFEELRKSTNEDINLYKSFIDGSLEAVSKPTNGFQESEAYNDLSYEKNKLAKLESEMTLITSIIDKLYSLNNKQNKHL